MTRSRAKANDLLIQEAEVLKSLALIELEEEEAYLKKEIEKAEARSGMLAFTQYTKRDYKVNWFHRAICKKLDAFERGDIKKLMIFVPPQHGKSELSSRRFPSFALGKNPDRKIGICSFSADLAQDFNRDVQRIIDSEEYVGLFPETKLNTVNVSTDAKRGYKRTANIFEVVGHTGSLKTVGIKGTLTGSRLDIGIVDDPVKDREEASSSTRRQRVWDWYVNVFEARMHNDSQQLVLLTRWHDDDLAGRILKRDGKIEDGGEWDVVVYRGLKEPGDHLTDDPREVGEALWEDRHSRKRIEKVRDTAPITFASLYQQRPSLEKGNIVKRDWFGWYDLWELERVKGLKRHAYIDTATSEKEKLNNDPTGILVYTEYRNRLYLLYFRKGLWGFPEQIKQIKQINETWKINGINWIENKSNGASVKQQIAESTKISVGLDNPGVLKKMERLDIQTERIQTGRVFLPKGEAWVEDFIEHICSFPSLPHDEEVDCLTGAMRKIFAGKSGARYAYK